ncbi:hypothetical protein PsorP6_012711 [Peronosclerospora sorghi]|uniref:Uncharacterized protein n=1 Tax=Peronosclerospora sorghi TaxID=230839 RepID=A0ACC0WI84_9STRA|nr:hypothetical protein PsorP6_012711 [Peronosclerospora sorghi]
MLPKDKKSLRRRQNRENDTEPSLGMKIQASSMEIQCDENVSQKRLDEIAQEDPTLGLRGGLARRTMDTIKTCLTYLLHVFCRLQI